MIDQSYWMKFEQLVREVLVHQGFDLEMTSSRRRQLSDPVREIDILAKHRDGRVRPVEVKLTSRETVTLSRLRDASSLTSNLKGYAYKAKPLLVFGAGIDRDRREWAEREFDIEIWDRDTLLRHAGPVRQRLHAFFQRFDQGAKSEPRSASVVPLEVLAVSSLESTLDPAPEPKGDVLIAKLAGIKPGKMDSKKYEKTCQEIIDYLFGGDLLDVRSQKRTSDRLNIYDMVYRVNPKHAFWVTLTRDFRARVVLFECKNYGKPIGPGQVFTTERYLSSSALRPICFVLSRKAPHRHALQAAFGAMRDSGKLLVFLSDDDLIQMIRAKDAQLREGGSPADMAANDPTEVLDQRIYDFIAAMPR